MNENSKLNGNVLKFIAIIAMTIDHVTSTFFPGYNYTWWIILLHLIGRLTAPIMCWFIAEGFRYTHNLQKYAGRLFLFAVIGHFAYNFCFGISFIPFQNSVLNQTSVLWPLFLGLVSLCVQHSKSPYFSGWKRMAAILVLCALAFPSDWSCIAVLWILFMDEYHDDIKKTAIYMIICVASYALVYAIFEDVVYGLLQFGVIFSLPLLNMYNGKRGNWKGMKWFFYLYYPLHLTLCGVIRIYLQGK
jgi:hypothetical protein